MNKMIPSEIIHTDESGNAVIGKNLEVDGTAKLNGGIEPVFTDKFDLQNNEGTYKCTFIDYGEFKYSDFHLLYFSFDNDNTVTLGLGYYYTNNHKVTSFDIYGVSIVDQEFQIVSLPNTNFGTTPTYTSIATRP